MKGHLVWQLFKGPHFLLPVCPGTVFYCPLAGLLLFVILLIHQRIQCARTHTKANHLRITRPSNGSKLI